MLENDRFNCIIQVQNIFRKPDMAERKKMPPSLKNIFAEYVSCLLIIHTLFYFNKIILGNINRIFTFLSFLSYMEGKWFKSRKVCKKPFCLVFPSFCCLNMYMMARILAAALESWGIGQKNDKDLSPDIPEASKVISFLELLLCEEIYPQKFKLLKLVSYHYW